MNKRLENVLRDVMVEYKYNHGAAGFEHMGAWVKYALEQAEKVHDEDVRYLRGKIKELEHLIDQMEKDARAHKPHRKSAHLEGGVVYDGYDVEDFDVSLNDVEWDEVIKDWDA